MTLPLLLFLVGFYRQEVLEPDNLYYQGVMIIQRVHSLYLKNLKQIQITLDFHITDIQIITFYLNKDIQYHIRTGSC